MCRLCAILPAKAVPEMTYTVSGGTLNLTHSLTILHSYGDMSLQTLDARTNARTLR